MFKTYSLLNVVSHPHPKGIYRSLFEIAAGQRPVKFRSDQFTRISRITDSKDGIFRGRLAMWTEIDPNSPSVDKTSLKEMSLDEAGVELPANIGFNSRIFYFAFREKEHALYIELTNDEGRTITPSTAKTAFSKILAQAGEGVVEEVSVFVGTRADAIDYVLSLKAIRKIEIDLKLPNPDDLSEEHERALADLERMKAGRLQATLSRAKGEDTLVLLPFWRAAAELARNNGSVKTIGKNEYGEPEERNTKNMPAEIEEEKEGGDSSFAAIGRVARNGPELNIIAATVDDDDVLE